MTQAGPLAGVRVADTTHMLAGPYATWIMGALGAEVIKVEVPGRGDFTRRVAPFLGDDSIYFLSVNRNKRSITLNLKHAEGREAFLRLVERCDVVVENNRPGVMERLGLGYAAVAQRNSRIVYASVSGFGQSGPYSARPAFDAVVQAMAGTMSITGEEGRGPVRVGASIGDMSAGLFAIVGILSALQERQRTGRGAYVDVAMLDAQLALLENAVARYLNAGELPRRLGSRHPLIAPFQAFPTADDPIVVCVDTEAQWERLCAVLRRTDLVGHPAFTDGNARVRNHAQLEPLLIECFRKRGRAEWLALLEQAEVPAGPINSIAEVVADPQVTARGMISAAGEGRFVAQPIRMPGRDFAPERPAPALGADTDQVLRELGYDSEAIAHLRAAGAL
jgi:crotonobetainyl-CoA:carnitine CoA-transferase CaiB-like acyl-CoA transferase